MVFLSLTMVSYLVYCTSVELERDKLNRTPKGKFLIWIGIWLFLSAMPIFNKK